MIPSEKSRRIGLAVIGLAIVAIALSLPRLPQDPSYHRMADSRTILGVPNGLNVLSNIPFAIVGLAGVLALIRGSISDSAFVAPWERWPYGVLFAGTALTALGSSYYHLAPDDARLFWDRLPMTLGFMGLLTALLAERVSVTLARSAFVPLVLAGAGSVLYWRLGEANGGGESEALRRGAVRLAALGSRDDDVVSGASRRRRLSLVSGDQLWAGQAPGGLRPPRLRARTRRQRPHLEASSRGPLRRLRSGNAVPAVHELAERTGFEPVIEV